VEPTVHRFPHEAMTTPFEAVIAGQTSRYAAQAARAVFDEIDRIEGKLSRFIESSDVSRINRFGSEKPVRVSIETFQCLELAARVHRRTDGAFDVTARQGEPTGGTDRVELDANQFTVRLKAADVSIDLGGIGKGFALDRAAALLEDWSIGSALIHGGASTAIAVGDMPGKDGWHVSVGSGSNRTDMTETVVVRDRAVSGSGTAARGRHIIDPRTGRSVVGRVRTWASCPSGAVADALSTAFMVMSPTDIERYCRDHTGTWAMLLTEDDLERRLIRFGNWKTLDSSI